MQGTLRGYDQATNLILDECHERVYSSKVRPTACQCGQGDAATCQHAHSVFCEPAHPRSARLCPAGRRGAAGAWAVRRAGGQHVRCIGAHGGEGARTARTRTDLFVLHFFHIFSLLSSLPRSLCCARRAVVGEVDEDRDAALDFAQLRAPPLKPVTH